MSKPAVFTPNVTRGDPGERYQLFRHSDNMFSVTEDGPKFNFKCEAEKCGFDDCTCAAFITKTTRAGRQALKSAPKFGEPWGPDWETEAAEEQEYQERRESAEQDGYSRY